MTTIQRKMHLWRLMNEHLKIKVAKNPPKRQKFKIISVKSLKWIYGS